MRTTEIRVYPIGKTALDREAVHEWLSSLGVSEEAIQPLMSQESTDCANLVRLAGKRCYMAFEGDGKLNKNVQRVRDDIAQYLDHILQVGHGSVLEHVVYNFAVEGISRVLTAELNRHRAGVAISEGSMRFIRFNDLPYWLPKSIQPGDSDTRDIADRKRATRQVFEECFAFAEKKYAELEAIWADALAPTSAFQGKKQVTSMMRRIVPIGVSTGGVWSFNLRALRHVCTMRCDEAAEEEINDLANKLLRHMLAAEVHFFGDFQPNERGFWQPKYRKV